MPQIVLACTACCLLWTSTAGGQQAVVAERFVVASGHPDATAAGMGVLGRGGNVMDAAVATSLALGVAEPYGSGLGGKLVLLYRDGYSGRVECIVALCAAPRGIDAGAFAALPGDTRRNGYRSVGVPGYPAGLALAHRRWGSLPWRELVQPAMSLAAGGVRVNEIMRSLFEPKVESLQRDESAATIYLVQGDCPPVGTVLKNPDLAETLCRLAEEGVDWFYHGEVAERIVAAAGQGGSSLTMADMTGYRARLLVPLSARYRDCCVYSSPPPLTGGVTVLAALKCLEPERFSVWDPRGADYIDRVGCLLQGIYPLVRDKIADVPAASAEARRLLGGASIRRIRRTAGRGGPTSRLFSGAEKGFALPVLTGDQRCDASTSHLVVADACGNVVSLTQSLSFHFGASVVPPGTGILLNNSLSNFSTRDRNAVNYIAGGKWPRSTIAPVIVTGQRRPWLAFGIPGGQRIPTTTIQLLTDTIDHNVALADAIDQPRFHVRRPLSARQADNLVDIEDGMEDGLKTHLQQRGWQVSARPRDGHYFGGGNGVQFTADGRLLGAADLRRTNWAAGE